MEVSGGEVLGLDWKVERANLLARLFLIQTLSVRRSHIFEQSRNISA
jgi:hypothetical protein